MEEMTVERAIKILHPATSATEIAKIECHAGFAGKSTVVKEVDKACVIACETMERYLGKRESYIDQIRWERDIAVAQLDELGIGFGRKIILCKECALRGSKDCPMYFEEEIEYDDGDYIEYDYVEHDNTQDDWYCPKATLIEVE